jgi:undecaprenyl-diphosphatase
MATKTKTTPVNGRTTIYLAACIAGIIVFGLGAYFASSGHPTGWESSWFTAINGWSEGWYRFFTIATFFGSTWMALVSVVTVFAFRMYRLAWRLAFTIIGAYGVAYLAKHIIGRERPAELLANVHARAVETGMGFPSGHATLSTVIACTVWPYLPAKLRYVVVPLFIGVVCLSRLYLGVHFPLDIVGGIAIGIAAVSFVRILPRALRTFLRLA